MARSRRKAPPTPAPPPSPATTPNSAKRKTPTTRNVVKTLGARNKNKSPSPAKTPNSVKRNSPPKTPNSVKRKTPTKMNVVKTRGKTVNELINQAKKQFPNPSNKLVQVAKKTAQMVKRLDKMKSFYTLIVILFAIRYYMQFPSEWGEMGANFVFSKLGTRPQGRIYYWETGLAKKGLQFREIITKAFGRADKSIYERVFDFIGEEIPLSGQSISAALLQVVVYLTVYLAAFLPHKYDETLLTQFQIIFSAIYYRRKVITREINKIGNDKSKREKESINRLAQILNQTLKLGQNTGTRRKTPLRLGNSNRSRN